MTRSGFILTVLLLSVAASVPVAGEETVLAISKFADFLYEIDPSVASIVDDVELSGANLNEGFTAGLAVSPIDRRSPLRASLEGFSPRE